MRYKEIVLRANDTSGALTEIKFEIATARAENAELIVIRYSYGEAFSSFIFKVSQALRKMKQKRLIQLFAFSENFSRGGTESVYLKNKYSELFADAFPSDGDRILYIKL